MAIWPRVSWFLYAFGHFGRLYDLIGQVDFFAEMKHAPLVSYSNVGKPSRLHPL